MNLRPRIIASDYGWYVERDFRDREFGDVAPHAWPCINVGPLLRATGWVSMRSLHLKVPNYPWDGLLFWLHRRRRQHSDPSPAQSPRPP